MAVLLDTARPGVARRPARAHVLLGLGATAVVALVLAGAQRGPAGRILASRPVPESHPALWGFDHWIALVQIATLVATSLFLGWFLLWSRRHGRPHPALPVLAALFVMGLLTDSFANWTSSAAMNPQLLHYPTDWWFFSVSPTVEPLINTVAYPYLFLGPALAVVRFPGPRRSRWTAFAVTYVVALPINLLLVNLFMVRIEYWTYTQIPGWAAVRGGTAWQYPWTDTLTLSVLTAATAVLLCRDAEPGRSMARRVLAGVLITALAYVPYNAVWASFRLTDSGNSLARPWPYQNTKVYDPKGDYARAGVPGPYFRGVWP